MSFAEIASKVIKESIVSALYIDDKIVEPFEESTDENKKYFDVSKGLYDSFRQENKSIDFYKFMLNKDWRSEADYIFNQEQRLVNTGLAVR
jgi:hypothetical protein